MSNPDVELQTITGVAFYRRGKVKAQRAKAGVVAHAQTGTRVPFAVAAAV